MFPRVASFRFFLFFRHRRRYFQVRFDLQATAMSADVYKGFGFVRIGIGVGWWIQFFFIFISEWDHSNFAIKIVTTNEFLIFFLYLLASPNWLLCVRLHSHRTGARTRPQYRNRILPRPDISTPPFIRITLQYLFTILNEAYLLRFFFALFSVLSLLSTSNYNTTQRKRSIWKKNKR